MLGLFGLFLRHVAEFKGDKQDIPISYYSMAKACHIETRMCLSSMEYSYTGGGRQQMTRATKFTQLAETLWTIFPASNATQVHQGDPVRCGDRVRLYHATTRVWLHSQKVPSQLDHGHQVGGSVGQSDANDWIIVCDREEGPTLATQVVIKHAHIGCFLATTEEAELPVEIAGQWEVFCDDTPDRNEWYVDKGIFVGGKVDEKEDPEGNDAADSADEPL
jgi:dolichyl-phosphate-mannose--protein O-mannosyl transferase